MSKHKDLMALDLAGSSSSSSSSKGETREAADAMYFNPVDDRPRSASLSPYYSPCFRSDACSSPPSPLLSPSPSPSFSGSPTAQFQQRLRLPSLEGSPRPFSPLLPRSSTSSITVDVEGISRPSTPSSSEGGSASGSSSTSALIPSFASLYPFPVGGGLAPWTRAIPYRRAGRPAKAALALPPLGTPVTARAPRHQCSVAEILRKKERQRRRERLCTLGGLTGLVCCLAALFLIVHCTAPARARLQSLKARHRRVASAVDSDGVGSFWKRDETAAPTRDTLVLYRIIGNDLPPRHSPGQTLTNLRFLLEHEHSFDALPSLRRPLHHARGIGGRGGRARATSAPPMKVEKYWVLNRLANATQIGAVWDLLRSYDVPPERILEIPFEWPAYNRRNWRWDGGVGWGEGMELVWGLGRHSEHEELHRIDAGTAALGTASGEVKGGEAEKEEAWTRRREAMARLRALDFTYHEKNLYAMNNNGGRNFALDHGRSLPHARWILPLDGNCFFSPSAIMSLMDALDRESRSHRQHVVIPMARMLSNAGALVNNSAVPAAPGEALRLAPHAPDEPQVGFRWDSTERYSEAMRYGRRSKLELLWRLGALDPARDLHRRTHPWESAERELFSSRAHGSIRSLPGEAEAAEGKLEPGYIEAGWVLRLFSGDQSQEEHSAAANTRRSVNRIKGIVAFLEVLDEGVARGFDVCGHPADGCGFGADRLWAWDGDELARWRGAAAGDGGAPEGLVGFGTEAAALLLEVEGKLESKGGWSSGTDDAEWVAASAATLALAGTVLDDPVYSRAAARLIYARFLRPVAVEERDLGEGSEPFALDAERLLLDVDQGDGVGYAFPIPRHSLTPAWLKPIRRRLPFDPFTFDPTLLLDAIRLLSSDWRPAGTGSAAAAFPELPYDELDEMFTAQLSYLLLHPAGQRACSHPSSTAAGALYDLKVAALAAFLDDAQLLGRVANRSQLRMPPPAEGEAEGAGPELEAALLRERLWAGLRHVKLRPFDGFAPGRGGRGLRELGVKIAAAGSGAEAARRLMGEVQVVDAAA